MMDCKTALKESGGDMTAAQEFLRKKGLASAEKKAGRIAAEGAIVSYIHAGSRLGVIAEVNCETDFVARGETFQDFASDVAMQVQLLPCLLLYSLRARHSLWPAGHDIRLEEAAPCLCMPSQTKHAYGLLVTSLHNGLVQTSRCLLDVHSTQL
jgi:hypothetical protein